MWWGDGVMHSCCWNMGPGGHGWWESALTLANIGLSQRCVELHTLRPWIMGGAVGHGKWLAVGGGLLTPTCGPNLSPGYNVQYHPALLSRRSRPDHAVRRTGVCH